MYRFLATPKWIAGSVIAVSAVVAFVSLGLWQLSRLEERRTYNAVLAERLEQPPVGAAELVRSDADAIAYRRAALSGTYEPEREVLLAARTLHGRSGHHVLTPLRTELGLVIVDRGWVPLEENSPPIAAAAPPGGPVEVDGVLMPPQAASRSGAFGAGGDLEFVNAVDLDRLEGWLGEELAPLYVLAQGGRPAAPGELPVVVPPPEAEEGNHLSYAVQWFLFAGVVAVGFPVLVRRTAQDRAGGTSRAERAVQQPVGS